jgi:hypothetical protein
LVKVIHLALALVQAAAALQDRYRKFLDESIRRVPEERRVAPLLRYLARCLRGLDTNQKELPSTNYSHTCSVERWTRRAQMKLIRLSQS